MAYRRERPAEHCVRFADALGRVAPHVWSEHRVPQPLHAHTPPPDAFDAWGSTRMASTPSTSATGTLKRKRPSMCMGCTSTMSAVEVSAAGYGYYVQEPVF